MTTQITSAPSRQRVTQREDGRRELSEARRSRDITTLLDKRDELRGVYAMADLIDDGVRWTA